jgi:hypothetical protein
MAPDSAAGSSRSFNYLRLVLYDPWWNAHDPAVWLRFLSTNPRCFTNGAILASVNTGAPHWCQPTSPPLQKP